jgi:hypothetical protein
LGDFRERWRTAKDEQGQNKRPSSAKFPPSLAKFDGRIWGYILKRGHSLFSYVEGQFRPFTNVGFFDPTGNLGEIQIVEKGWMSRQVSTTTVLLVAPRIWNLRSNECSVFC